MSLPASRPVRPAARAAAAPPEEPPGDRPRIPGIVGRAVERIGGLPVGEERGHVGLAEDDGARPPEALDRYRVPLGFVPFLVGEPPGRGQATNVEGLLHGHGHPMQRPQLGAALDRDIRLLGVVIGSLKVHDDDGVEQGIRIAGSARRRGPKARRSPPPVCARRRRASLRHGKAGRSSAPPRGRCFQDDGITLPTPRGRRVIGRPGPWQPAGAVTRSLPSIAGGETE